MLYTIEMEFQLVIELGGVFNAFRSLPDFPTPCATYSLVNKISNLDRMPTKTEALEIAQHFSDAYVGTDIDGRKIVSANYVGMKSAYRQEDDSDDDQ